MCVRESRDADAIVNSRDERYGALGTDMKQRLRLSLAGRLVVCSRSRLLPNTVNLIISIIVSIMSFISVITIGGAYLPKGMYS